MENQNTTGTAPEQQQEKTFTQEQVNAIVGKRLAEAKASHEVESGKREAELNQREMALRAKELLSEKGLPKNLADVLRYSDEESLIAAIDVIDKTRGFKEGLTGNEQVQNNQRKIEPHKLPPHDEFGSGSSVDPFRRAMGLE